jgi:ATP-binding cassette subfamily B protein
VEREAFSRAWRFLGYQPLAKWAALTGSVISALLYAALLLVLALFADLLVTRGRIPDYQTLSVRDGDAFLDHWTSALTADERHELLLGLGVDPRSATDLSRTDDPARMSQAERELAWRAHLHTVLSQRVDPAAAALVLPEFNELPPAVQQNFLVYWRGLLERDRREQLAVVADAPAALAGDTSKLTAEQRSQLWRIHLRYMLDDNRTAASTYWSDRTERELSAESGGATELVDRGVLSLLIRSEGRAPDRVATPLLGMLARWAPWTWEPGTPERPTYIHYLNGLAALAIILALLRGVSTFIGNYAAAIATTEASNRLRRAVYHHTYRLGTLVFRAMGVSEAVSVFTRQLEAVHDAMYTRLTVFCREPVKFFLLLALALALNPTLALVFLLFALLVWLIGGQVAAFYRRQEREGTRRAAEHLAMLQECLLIMRLVKGYLMELFNQSRVERLLSRYSEAQLRSYRGEAIYRPLLVFLGTLAGVILLYVGGLNVLGNRLGVARVVTLATALVSLYFPLVACLENRRFLRRGREAAAILFKFLDRPGEVGQVVGAEFLPPLSDRLEFDNISLREPGTGRYLLQDVSLTIRAGTRAAIVGPEDMEKHAFIYLIPRLLDPDAGEIRIDRHNLRWVTFDSLRAQIAFVLQRNLLFNDTVANNIGCGDPSYDLPKIIDAAKAAHAHQFIQKLPKGYETPVGEMGHALNIGEQFRVALARAILRDPALLIIEEPPMVLDDDTKALIDDTYARALPGRTVIFLPHRMSTIRSCDRVFLLHNGRVEAAGDHRELLAQSELYRHLQYLEFNAFADELIGKGA